MQVENHTPFAQLVYANEDAQARMFNILIVKATYALDAEFHLKQSPEQEPLNFSDLCHADFNTSALRYPSDLVPFKPQAEVILTADAHAPDGNAMSRWQCGLALQGISHRQSAEVEVCGPRQWQPRWRHEVTDIAPRNGHHPDFRGWHLSDPAPVRRVPLRYELASGGGLVQDDIVTVDERNPLGCGWIDRDLTDHLVPQPAPQILAPGTVLTDPYARPEPVGLGPIPPAWLPRRPLGGTYDAAWLQKRWPHWPEDYDFAYHNSAPAALRWPGFLAGNEAILLHHLRPERPDIVLWLPGEAVVAQMTDLQGRITRFALNADTLFLDLTEDRPEDCLITLTWRLALREADWAELVVETCPVGSPGLTPAPHPADLFDIKSEVSHEQ